MTRIPQSRATAVVKVTDSSAAWSAVSADPDRQEVQTAIKDAGSTVFGGGFLHYKDDSSIGPWLTEYDEVFYVIEGELTVTAEGAEPVTAAAGEALLLRHGASVHYAGARGSRAFYVTFPRDWADGNPLVDATGDDAGGGSA